MQHILASDAPCHYQCNESRGYCCCKTCQHELETHTSNEACCCKHTYHEEYKNCDKACSGYLPFKTPEKPGKPISLKNVL
jgi:hypothetical protein